MFDATLVRRVYSLLTPARVYRDHRGRHPEAGAAADYLGSRIPNYTGPDDVTTADRVVASGACAAPEALLLLRRRGQEGQQGSAVRACPGVPG